MPRQGRLHIPGGYYHVMGRGLERRRIFQSKFDKQDFLSRLESGLIGTDNLCLAWSIMSNHYHLLIQVGVTPLKQLMHPLLGGYAGCYNRRHKRAGYVFQNRYKSILCDEEKYLLQLIRYIHLNPVKAGLVKSTRQLDSYPWTGHACIVKNRSNAWQNISKVLDWFGGNNARAVVRYKEFIREGVNLDNEDLFAGGGLIRSYRGWDGIQMSRKEHEVRIGDERILGETSFVENALRQDELAINRKTQLDNAGWDIEKLIEYICREIGVENQSLLSKGRNNKISHARALVCYFAFKELCLSSSVIATRLAISQPAVSQSVKRGEVLRDQLKIELDD